MNILSIKLQHMPPRRYRLGRRAAETAEETRRRIVEATHELHMEQPIRATSMVQIAERAGVGVGTVYHHFPTYEDAVAACGRFTVEKLPLPTADIVDGISPVAERVRRVAAEVFSYYERFPAFERIRAERHGLAPVEAFVAAEERNRVALMREALRPFTRDPRLIGAAAALLDPAVHSGLRRSGLTSADAAADIAGFILARLGTQPLNSPEDVPDIELGKESPHGNQDR
jgi:AcrR family transcriptional regulator